MTARIALPDDMHDPVLLPWLDAALSLGPDACVPIDGLEELLRGPRRASQAAFGHVLRNEANPYRGTGPLVVTARAARDDSGYDLLRYAFEPPGIDLRITDGINFTLVRAAFRYRPLEAAPDRADYTRSLLEAVVRLETSNHRWTVELPAGFAAAGGPQIAANRDAPPVRDLSSRHERMDLLAIDLRIHFLFYKKIDQLELWQKDSAWFSPDAREAVLARMTPGSDSR